MTDRVEKVLSAHDAARIIYNTAAPTPEQVGQVGMHLMRGHLKAGPGGPSTTTRQAVADFMAAIAATRQQKAQANRPMAGFYRELMRDYFLAVVTRRKFGQRSGAFERAVLAGQVAGLLLAVAGIVWIIRGAAVVEPPERRLVRQFVQQQLGPVKFHEWSPTQSPDELSGMLVRVQFSYRSGNKKMVRTDRSYLVTGDQVQEYSGDDSD